MEALKSVSSDLKSTTSMSPGFWISLSTKFNISIFISAGTSFKIRAVSILVRGNLLQQ
jgi:hypothetical protein